MWVLGNLAAGRGRGGRLAPRLEELLRSLGISGSIFWPATREELRRLAAAGAAAGVGRMIVVGGDGTLADVAGEVWRQGIEIGLVPAGDANDFAAAIGLPEDPLEAARHLAGWQTRSVDLVRVCLSDGSERVYAGGGGAGLDAVAARWAAGPFRRFPGVWRYLAGAVVGLAGFKPFPLSLDCDSGSYRGRVFLAVVANTAWYGGRIRIAPDARPDDGLLEIALLESVSWAQVLRALGPLIRSGEPRGLRFLRYRARRAHFETAEPVPFHGDGELFGSTPLSVEVVPGALRVVAPPAAGG